MPHDKPRPKLERISKDSFARVIREFMNTPKFQGYSRNTKMLWGGELAFIERSDILGAIPVDQMRPALVQAFLDGLSGRPGKQAAARAALKQLEKWALRNEKIPNPIVLGTEIEHSDGGHMPWTDAQVASAELNARRDIANAISLAVNTGQRCSDLIRMRWSDIEVVDGLHGINVTQVKTGKKIWVPLTKLLLTATEYWRKDEFLITSQGKPWGTPKALSQAWTYERNTNAALVEHRDANLVMHGLRATACVRLSRVGANTRQIASMVGMSEDVVIRYTRFSQQKEDALAAVKLLDKAWSQDPQKPPRK